MIDPLKVPCPLCGGFPECIDEHFLVLQHKCPNEFYTSKSWINKGINGVMGYLLRDRIIFSNDRDPETGREAWWIDFNYNGPIWLGPEKPMEDMVIETYNKVINYRASLQDGTNGDPKK